MGTPVVALKDVLDQIESASERLVGKLSEIQRQTFTQRVERYGDALRKSGYFYYDGKKITADGDIHYPGKVFNIKGDIPIFRGLFYVCHEIKGGNFFGGPKRYYVQTTSVSRLLRESRDEGLIARRA